MMDIIHVEDRRNDEGDNNTTSYSSNSSAESRNDHQGGRRKRSLLKSKNNGAIGKSGDASDSNLQWLASQLAGDLVAQSVFECITDAVFCGIREREYGVSEETQEQNNVVRVKVLATTVPQNANEDERREPRIDIDGALQSSHFVGMIQKTTTDPRERRDPNIEEVSTIVTSIRKCHYKSRYTNVSSSELIPIPGSIDPGEAVSIISTFLPAFEALHHGDRRERDFRYSPTSLEGKQVLITGGDCLEAQAAVKLAVWARAAGVFVLNSGNVLSKRMHGGHVAVLSEDPQKWLPVVQGDMDVVIDFEYPKNVKSVIASMTRKGRLVCKYPEKDSHHHESSTLISKLYRQTALCAMSQASMFDFDDYVKTNMEDVKKDILFLFELLERRRIRPNIDRYVKVRDIPIVQEEMRTHAMIGAVVCEPWNSKG